MATTKKMLKSALATAAATAAATKRRGAKKKAISPFGDASRKKILVLLSASVNRFGVFRMRDFFIKQMALLVFARLS